MKRTTTERGYGSEHQKKVKAAHKAFQPGQPCARCHQPIWHISDADLGHIDGTPHYAGLEHKRCNRRAGAYRKQRLYGQGIYAGQVRIAPQPRRTPWLPSRQW